MALPTSRDVTFAPGSQIPSSVLNNIQDNIIGAKHGDVTRYIPIPIIQTTGTSPSLGDFFGNITTPISSNSPYYTAAGTGAVPDGRIAVPLPISIGDRIKQIDAFVYDNAGGSVNIALTKHLLTGVPPGTTSSIGGTTVSGSTTTLQKLSILSLTEVAVADTIYHFNCLIDGSHPSLRFYAATVTFDRP